MQYCTSKLNKPIQERFVIATLFGKFIYKNLPMELKYAPDFVHQVMEDVLCEVDKYCCLFLHLRTPHFTP